MPVLGASAGAIRRIGAVPRNPTVDTTVPGEIRLKYQFAPAYIDSVAGLLTCLESHVDSDIANGSYLYGEDGIITIADINGSRPIVISGRYSGCKFRVFQTGPDAFTCMHIYNPGRHSTLPAVADRYMAAQRGIFIAELGSVGLALPGSVDSVWFACEIVAANIVQICRMSVDSRGSVVASSVGTYPGRNNMS